MRLIHRIIRLLYYTTVRFICQAEGNYGIGKNHRNQFKSIANRA